MLVVKTLLVAVVMCLLIAGCSMSLPLPVPATPTPMAGTEPRRTLVEREFDLSAGEAVVSLRASAPGTDWGRRGAEAATVSIYLDDKYRADIVLFRGETAFDYQALLGTVTGGKHKVSVYLEPAKSAASVRDVQVEDLTTRVYEPTDPLYVVMAHAPILYGREDARYSDTPLLMYHEVTKDAISTTIQYTIIFSNEDGGTAPDGLMARWGRLTDIEFVYRVSLDAQGQILGAQFQDKDHHEPPYAGSREGFHPLLKDVTRNNLFADSGTSPYRFALVPTQRLTEGSREELMDLNPWTYLVMAQEWQREGQDATEKTASPQTRAVSDPRNYLYLEYRSGPTGSGPCDAKLAVQARLRGAETWYSSDHGVDSLRIQSVGWHRAAIELPPGTAADQVEALRFAVYPGKNQPQCSLTISELRKAFLLDERYQPGPSVVTWQGSETIAPVAAEEPGLFTIPVGRR